MPTFTLKSIGGSAFMSFTPSSPTRKTKESVETSHSRKSARAIMCFTVGNPCFSQNLSGAFAFVEQQHADFESERKRAEDFREKPSFGMTIGKIYKWRSLRI